MSLDIGWAQLGSSHLVIRTWGLPYSCGHMMAMAEVILSVSSFMCLLAGTPGDACHPEPHMCPLHMALTSPLHYS